MATTVTALSAGRSGSDADKQRNFSVSYFVQSDTALDEAEVLALSDLPQIGAAHPTDVTAFVTSRSAQQDGSGFDWLVNVQYGRADADSVNGDEIGNDDPDTNEYRGGGFPEGDPATWEDGDPTRLAWTYEQGSQSVNWEHIRLKGLNEDTLALENDEYPAINTAGDPHPRPPVIPIDFPVLILTKNVPDSFLTTANAANYQGSVNSDEIWVASFQIKKYDAVMRRFSLRRARWTRTVNGVKTLTPYWELSIEILFYGTGSNDAAVKVLQIGDRQKLTTTSEATSIVVGPFSQKYALLDANGKQSLTNPPTPYWKYFQPPRVMAWAPLKLPRKV